MIHVFQFVFTAIPVPQILELFGQMFFEFCQESGYDKILQVLGSTTHGFLQNLDALHDHLSSIYPGMRAPSFRCSERKEDGATILHYYSERDGLEYIVIGLVKTVAKRLHNSEVEVEVLKEKNGESDHVQFVIIDKGRKEGREDETSMSLVNSLSKEPKISTEEFCEAFPFHIMFNKNMNVVQAGICISRVIPELCSPGRKINTIFEMVRPHMEFNFTNISAHINTVYVLCTIKGAERKISDEPLDVVYSDGQGVSKIENGQGTSESENKQDVSKPKNGSMGAICSAFKGNVQANGGSKEEAKPNRSTDNGDIDNPNLKPRFRIKGQMIYLEKPNLILFLCSPNITNVEDLKLLDMSIDDIPLHDATHDLISLSEQFGAEYKLTQSLEILTDKLQQTHRELEVEKAKTDRYAVTFDQHCIESKFENWNASQACPDRIIFQSRYIWTVFGVTTGTFCKNMNIHVNSVHRPQSK